MKRLLAPFVVALGAARRPLRRSPGPPPPLPGNPSLSTQQQLNYTVVDQQGHVVFQCLLNHDAVLDLGFTTLRVVAKTGAAGCPSSDWLDKRAIASCSVGGTLDCGAGWALPVGPTYEERFFQFTRTPHLATIHTTFQATFRVGPTPVAVQGTSPRIRCSNELEQCKFQT